MKEDLKDIIINIARAPTTGGHYNYSNDKNCEDYWTNDTGKSKKKNGKYQTDRLSPLKQWLKKQVGRPWDNIWSEICAVCDDREIRGYHLRDHVLNMVRNNGISQESWPINNAPFISRAFDYFIDNKGFLRSRPYKRYKYIPLTKYKNQIEKYGNHYINTEHGWFKTQQIYQIDWTSFPKEDPFEIVPFRDQYFVKKGWNNDNLWIAYSPELLLKNKEKIRFVVADYKKCDDLELKGLR